VSARRDDTPTILVACASEWLAPARLPRVLHRAGAHVVAFCPSRWPLAQTRFVDEVIDAPPTLDAFVEALADHLADAEYDWVLIVDDPLLEALAARRAEPWLEGVLPIAGTHPWSRALASKADFCALAAAAGLPVPASRTCITVEDARAAADALGLPLMLKTSGGFAGIGVRLVRERRELDASFAALADSRPVVAQRFIDGPVGNTVVLYDCGVPICWMSAFKVRTWPGPFGPSSARQFMSHQDVEAIIRAVGTRSGYHGFCALDWVLDSGGRLQVIELNARPVPTIHMGALAGVDFSRAVRELLAGVPRVQSPRPRARRVVPMFPEDVWRAASENTLSLATWLPWPGRFSDVPWLDPPLLLHHLRRFAWAARDARQR
jgi:glutathione synthase/RimK-type ligase-like ATP-grasp enzyme